MKNFTLIGYMATAPAMQALSERGAALWNKHPVRTTMPGSPHREVSDIILRFQDYRPYLANNDIHGFLEEQECVCFPAWEELEKARRLAFTLMANVDGLRLGRVLITKLPPGGIITRHVDDDSHIDYYDRFHIVLQGEHGSTFHCGEDKVDMLTGEVWQFNNAEEHSVHNASAVDRIHLLVDIHTRAKRFKE